MTDLPLLPAPWQGVALVCRKCGKKLDGGFGKKGKRKLSQELKSALRATGRRRAMRVMEVGCLGLCPKRAVTVALEGGHLLAVPEGTAAEAVLPALLPN